MCKALLPGDDEGVSDDAIWETLPVSFSSICLSKELLVGFHCLAFRRLLLSHLILVWFPFLFSIDSCSQFSSTFEVLNSVKVELDHDSITWNISMIELFKNSSLCKRIWASIVYPNSY